MERNSVNLADRVRANVRHLLEAKGWAYSDLGWPRHYVSHVLTGEYGLSTARIQEFADRLKCDVSELTKEPPKWYEERVSLRVEKIIQPKAAT